MLLFATAAAYFMILRYMRSELLRALCLFALFERVCLHLNLQAVAGSGCACCACCACLFQTRFCKHIKLQVCMQVRVVQICMQPSLHNRVCVVLRVAVLRKQWLHMRWHHCRCIQCVIQCVVVSTSCRAMARHCDLRPCASLFFLLHCMFFALLLLWGGGLCAKPLVSLMAAAQAGPGVR